MPFTTRRGAVAGYVCEFSDNELGGAFPTYGQPDKDDQARQALQSAFPKYDLVAVDCRSLIRQHGSLHCATMQFPRGVLVRPNV